MEQGINCNLRVTGVFFVITDKLFQQAFPLKNLDKYESFAKDFWIHPLYKAHGTILPVEKINLNNTRSEGLILSIFKKDCHLVSIFYDFNTNKYEIETNHRIETN